MAGSLLGEEEYREMLAKKILLGLAILALLAAAVLWLQQQRPAAKAPKSIPDRELQAAILQELGRQGAKEALDISQFTLVTQLQASKRWIQDLTGLDLCENLRTIDLSLQVPDQPSLGFSSIDPLEELAFLEDINISHNNVSDLTPLCSSDRLERLDVSGNPITALPDAACFPALSELNVGMTCIRDQAQLGAFSQLQILRAYGPVRTDLGWVRSLTKLRKLDLLALAVDYSGCPLDKIHDHTTEELERLDEMRPILDVSPLLALQELEEVDLSRQAVRDVQPLLEGLPRLRRLVIRETRLTSNEVDHLRQQYPNVEILF